MRVVRFGMLYCCVIEKITTNYKTRRCARERQPSVTTTTVLSVVWTYVYCTQVPRRGSRQLLELNVADSHHVTQCRLRRHCTKHVLRTRHHAVLRYYGKINNDKKQTPTLTHQFANTHHTHTHTHKQTRTFKHTQPSCDFFFTFENMTTYHFTTGSPRSGST